MKKRKRNVVFVYLFTHSMFLLWREREKKKINECFWSNRERGAKKVGTVLNLPAVLGLVRKTN